MAGTLLAPDQIRRLNAAFPALVNHLRSLLAADHTGYGLMRVHSQVESFDSDEMVAIFREVNFISPLEKKALVRAAIYELMAAEPELFVSPVAPIVVKAGMPIDADALRAGPGKLEVFTPNFKLNIAKSGAEEVAKTDTKPTPPPPTSTAVAPKTVSDRIVEGNKEQKAVADKLSAAVAKLRAESASPAVDAPNFGAAGVGDVLAEPLAPLHEAVAEAMKLVDQSTPEAPAAPQE